MNITRKSALALMALALAGGAQADGWRGHHRQGWSPRGPVYVQRSDWLAPLIVLGIAGAAIGAAASAPAPVVVPLPPPAPPQPQVLVYPAAPVYAMPAPAVAPLPPGVAYYCPAYGQYHPQVQSCPGSWQLVDLPR